MFDLTTDDSHQTYEILITLRIWIATLVLLPAALLAADEPPVIPLWANGAPGFEDRRNEPVQAASYWVKNVHNPSSHAGHAFNMGTRSKLATIKGWPDRVADWLADNKILDAAVPVPNAK